MSEVPLYSCQPAEDVVPPPAGSPPPPIPADTLRTRAEDSAKLLGCSCRPLACFSRIISSLTLSDPLVCEPYPLSGEYRGTSLIRNRDSEKVFFFFF